MKLFSLISSILASCAISNALVVNIPDVEDVFQFETTRVTNDLQLILEKEGNSTLTKRDIIANWISSNNQQSLLTFTGSIYVGNPGQRFNVIFDSGSFQLWVRSSKCTSQNCQGKSSFYSSKSATFSDTGVSSSPVQYADGTLIQGNYVRDTVKVWGRQKVDQFTFIEATTAANIYGVDGVLGVARPYNDDIKQYMFLYQLLKTNTMTWPCYSWFIDKTSSKGQLVVGGVDYSKFSGRLSWTNVISGDAYWSVSFGAISGNNVYLQPPGGLKAVFDTGTSLAYLLPSLAQSLNNAIGATLYSNNGGVQNYVVDCSKVPYLPELTFNFGSINLRISANEYIYNFGNNFCMSGFVGMTIDPNIGILIGNVMLRRWYTVFDMGKNRIGFADSIR